MLPNKRSLACLLLVLAAAVSAVAAGTAPKLPSYVRLRLAGGNLEDEGSYIKYDPSARYYLIATGDCDGASIGLVLTPDPKPYGYNPSDEYPSYKGVRVTLPRLHTGTGVNIGETPDGVKRKLGRAPHKASYNARKRERVWTYEATIPFRGRQDLGPRHYEGVYTFRNERLWSISYGAGSGCGE